jgi:hypothetical protein
MALTTIDIENYLRKYSQFRGVFAIDRLPFEILPKPFGIVVNLDPSWQSGSHWVAVYAPETGPLIYFDSFGLVPPENLLTFLERNTKSHGYELNKSIFQGELSIKCGHYCLLFLESCFLNYKLPLFKCKTDVNENIIKNIY